jgi:hypothetical protein
MKRRTKHTWLFAFTDLSFILLLSLSLIPSAPADISLHIAEMNLPMVPESANLRPVPRQQESWELQIFSSNVNRKGPFRLVRAGSKEGMDLDEKTLVPALEKLREQNIRPALLPEKTSLTQDFLFAAGALAKVWSGVESGPIVKPIPEGGSE